VFHAAGVDTDWIECSPVQSCYVPEQFLKLEILPRASKDNPISRDGMAETTTCKDTELCSTSYVYYDRVTAFSENTGSLRDVTLAYVMAHEIGHLLGLGHRPNGIMTAGFTARDLNNAAAGWFHFADEDVQRLQRGRRAHPDCRGPIAPQASLIARQNRRMIERDNIITV
jgi:hypothetical protein